MTHDPDVFDAELGKVRVLAERCQTCIFWPGNRMHLPGGRLEELVEANVAADALLTCHQTLPYGPHPEVPPAVCAGFWAKHRRRTLLGRLAEGVTGVVRVDPPAETPPGDGPGNPE